MSEEEERRSYRVLCKYRGQLVLAEVFANADGSAGRCPECGSTRFSDDGHGWAACDCGFAYLLSDVESHIFDEASGIRRQLPRQETSEVGRLLSVDGVSDTNVELTIGEYSSLHQRLGYLEGLLLGLSELGESELLEAVKRGVARYSQISGLSIDDDL